MKKGRRLPSKLQRQQNKTENKPLGKLVGAARIRKRVYYLGGISPECSAEDIQNFCDPGCRLIECRMLPSRRYGTQAARLVVPENPEIKLESLDWPSGDTTPSFPVTGRRRIFVTSMTPRQQHVH